MKDNGPSEFVQDVQEHVCASCGKRGARRTCRNNGLARIAYSSRGSSSRCTKGSSRGTKAERAKQRVRHRQLAKSPDQKTSVWRCLCQIGPVASFATDPARNRHAKAGSSAMLFFRRRLSGWPMRTTYFVKNSRSIKLGIRRLVLSRPQQTASTTLFTRGIPAVFYASRAAFPFGFGPHGPCIGPACGRRLPLPPCALRRRFPLCLAQGFAFSSRGVFDGGHGSQLHNAGAGDWKIWPCPTSPHAPRAPFCHGRPRAVNKCPRRAEFLQAPKKG